MILGGWLGAVESRNMQMTVTRSTLSSASARALALLMLRMTTRGQQQSVWVRARSTPGSVLGTSIHGSTECSLWPCEVVSLPFPLFSSPVTWVSFAPSLLKLWFSGLSVTSNWPNLMSLFYSFQTSYLCSIPHSWHSNPFLHLILFLN